MGIVSDYSRIFNEIFDERRIAKLDKKIQNLGIARRANLKKALELTNRREKLLGQEPSR